MHWSKIQGVHYHYNNNHYYFHHNTIVLFSNALNFFSLVSYKKIIFIL